MNDKEKIKEALEFIERILKSDPHQTNLAEQNLQNKMAQFEIVKKILENKTDKSLIN